MFKFPHILLTFLLPSLTVLAEEKPKEDIRLVQVKDNLAQMGRVEVILGPNLFRKNEAGKEVDIIDEGWAAARYYYKKEKAAFTGNVILPNARGTNYTAKAILEFKDGRQEGVSMIMYPNSKKKLRGIFKNDVLQEAEGWHENQKRKFEAKLKNGELVKLQLWDEEGGEKTDVKLPKRMPSYIREVIAVTAFSELEVSRGVVPADDIWNGKRPFGRRLDSWLQQHANLEQRARYQNTYNKIRNLYLKQDFEPGRKYNLAQANLAAYRLIRNPKFSARYLEFFVGVQAKGGMLRGKVFSRISEVHNQLWGANGGKVFAICGRPHMSIDHPGTLFLKELIYEEMNMKFSDDNKVIMRLELIFNQRHGVVRILFVDFLGTKWEITKK